MTTLFESSTGKRNDNKYAICVTSKKSPPSGGATNATDAAQIFCPYTGKSLGAIKVGTCVGIQSISHLSLSDSNNAAFLAYVGKNQEDMNAALCTLQSSNSPKWKCRVPEYMDGGLKVSPCGRFVIGAGRSGHCYCWSTLNNGDLLRIWSAHYRSVHTVIFSDCGFYVITGGADGVVNAWSLLDLASQEEHGHLHQQNTSNISPIRTWSDHQLSVSCLHAMPSGRIISSSIDRQVVIMELFSGRTLARIMLPSAIETITSDKAGHRLYAGGTDGTIYCIDVDSYAIANTAESATIVSSNELSSFSAAPRGGSLQTDTILGVGSSGMKSKQNSNHAHKNPYVSELKGHEKAVSSLVLLEHDNHDDLLVSASQDGTVRIWDIRARCSTRVIRPWSTTATTPLSSTNQSNAKPVCPCSCVLLISREALEKSNAIASSSNDMFAGLNKQHGDNNNYDNNLSFIKPLQRFLKHKPQDQHNYFSTQEGTDIGNVVSLIKPLQDESNLDMWEFTSSLDRFKSKPSTVSPEPRIKKQKVSKTNEDAISNSGETESPNYNEQEELIDLKKELEDAKKTIERWKDVNNKLVQKLKDS
eukprot:CAMPEP_0197825820 /NCGR_PEP_ID=MMETSP1437-20131217/2852_1 /TAXON_ID=49252 ORGANISM="Eucampia antarctica, Strain CCMP1452" /NCGR_SAMPLE_ID=MMETSP1437 /ASSEMBLY_ACC=CAM_ASM_001096 /LENGTH=586 /DNA_ID=CAMNT_0043425987 /DNA_START=13 /DNA_END=1773 /DNA_ORIENTATION=-